MWVFLLGYIPLYYIVVDDITLRKDNLAGFYSMH